MFEWITAREPGGAEVRRRVQVLADGSWFVLARVLDREWEWGGQFDEAGREIDTQWLVEHGAIVRRTPMIEDRHTGEMRRRRKGE